MEKSYEDVWNGQEDGAPMARIKDVAREAGVAASTVSLVLNQKGYVSEATRQKVEAAMKKLNYIPSEVARNLSLSRTQTIGVILPSLSHPFFGELAEELEAALYHLDYKMMICCTQAKENSERDFVDMLRRRTMDGIIMGAHSLDLSIYDGLDQPIIAFDRIINPHIPIVHCDHRRGGQLAAEAFLRAGCGRIADIIGYQGVHSPAHEYHRAFRTIMEAYGVEVHVIELPWNAFGYADFLQTAERLFAEYPAVDGILGADMVVAACQHSAVARGYRIPEKLKLIAYDGTSFTRTGAQPITAVRQPIRQLARLAAEKIVRRVKGETDDLPCTCEPELIERETC